MDIYNPYGSILGQICVELDEGLDILSEGKNMGWKSDFYTLYFSKLHEHHKKALELKRDNLPPKLYRYRPVSDDNMEYRRRELLGGLYLSHPDELNDPFEGWSILRSNDPSTYLNKEDCRKFCVSAGKGEETADVFARDDWFDALIEYTVKVSSSECGVEKTKHALEQVVMNGLEMLNNHINKTTRKTVRIACFSTSPKNLPMWHHYTNGHTGICLEYDTTRMKDIYQINRLFPVCYVDKLPDMTHLLSHRKDQMFAFIEALCIHKLVDWSYENEWRLLYDAGSWYYSEEDVPEEYWHAGKEIFFMPPSKVILGKNIEERHEKRILEYADRYQICIEKAEFTNYGLEFR